MLTNLFKRHPNFTIFKYLQLCISAILLAGVLADPEAAAEPQQYPKSAYPAAYGQKYNNYCNPRKAPTCAKTGTETFCLKDTEYPEKEVKVSLVLTLIHFSNCFIYFCLIDFDSVRHRLRLVGAEEIRRCCRSVGR
jgi:hypothetical protein